MRRRRRRQAKDRQSPRQRRVKRAASARVRRQVRPNDWCHRLHRQTKKYRMTSSPMVQKNDDRRGTSEVSAEQTVTVVSNVAAERQNKTALREKRLQEALNRLSRPKHAASHQRRPPEKKGEKIAGIVYSSSCCCSSSSSSSSYNTAGTLSLGENAIHNLLPQERHAMLRSKIRAGKILSKNGRLR